MKQFLTVLKFEVKQKFKEKSFIISLVITALLFFGATFIPGLIGLGSSIPENIENMGVNQSLGESTTGSNNSGEKIGLLIGDGVDPSVQEALSQSYELEVYTDENSLLQALKEEKFEKAVNVVSNTEALVTKNQSSFGEFEDTQIKGILDQNYRYNIALQGLDITPDQLREINETTSTASIKSLGPDPITGYILSYIVMFVLYIMILMNGQGIATSVAKEKDNRTMELLVTTVKPSAMIWGKVISGVIASIVQILALVGALVLGIMINMGSSELLNIMLQQITSEVTFIDVSVFAGFTLVGVTLYYLLFAALGSLVSRLDEIQQACTPVVLIVVAAFMIPMFSMTAPDSIVMKVASLVPFTSPLAMFTRTQMTVVPTIEVLLGFAILVATTVIVAMAATKIYRNGTLNYGNRLNLWKALTRKAD